MGLWRDHLLPRLVDKGLDNDEIGARRARCLAGLRGEVLELGFGSGLNLAHLPAEVSRLHAVDPAVLGRKLAAERLAASAVPVDFIGLEAERLPLPDESMDGALSTFTLCTVADLPAALAELRRVLRPGAALHFLEHGLDEDAAIRRWQHRLEPIHKRVFGGCLVTRDIAAELERAGFALEGVERFRLPEGPRYTSAMWLGLARVG